MEDDNNTASKLINNVQTIIDKFDKVLENYELDKKFDQMSVDSICHLFPAEMLEIKEYIRHLEELCNKYEEEHKTVFKEWQEAIDILHKIQINGVEEENTTVLDLIKENKELKEKVKHYEETQTFGDYVKEVNLLVDYKTRIEKAVKYIKENAKYKKVSINNNKYYSEYLINQVLDILNGRSDE